ncbi:bifunctional metallophosphatase/5'-nucleotidase [Rathayibacter sp. AY1F6]|uniref:bifunctional metallophosphatase/5'-nucleotidase n=1 Tax=Rathayibacter sp. AY1F6 TaxID=2080560 RepID=UPI000CE918F3|nr:bifunctional UDP-sugar hydrolase/5'-nucleotidase [Rathayibacter sp. AY1F6]PPH02894.1 bifunctional metallophosphatase/5'-nucleotidase [Rathayibacter sp. AY1F6]
MLGVPFTMRSTSPGRRGLTRLLSATAVGAVAGAALLGATPAAAAEGDVAIDILSINDFHGRLAADRAVAGAAVLAGAVDSYRAANPNTLFVSAGDNIGASTFVSKVQGDIPTLDSLNAMGLDVSTLGNHEFDQGRADVDGRVVDASAFPYVNANLYDTATGERAYSPYVITEQDGVSVAFIGAITEDLGKLVSPATISTLSIEPIAENVNEVAAQLQDGDAANDEADVVVLLLHEGADADAAELNTPEADPKFGAIVNAVAPNVDAIVSGHSHQEYDAGIDAGRAFPTVVSQTGSYAENIGRMSLTVDPATKQLTSLTSEVVPLTKVVDDPTSDDPAKTIVVGAFEPDPEVETIVADAQAVAVREGSVKVGTITEDISRAYRPDGTTTNRGSESTLGNLVSDAQLWATRELGTQIAFSNAGGLRDDLSFTATPDQPGDADGVVTYAEASDAQPFANTLVTLQLTGEQISDLLEEQWVGSSSHPQLNLSTSKDLTYVFDATAPEGSRISQVFFQNEPIDPAATFTVVTSSFLASGGDGFSTFTEGTGTADSGRIDLDAFVGYIQDLGTVSPDPVQRTIGLTDNVPDSGEYAVGDTMTVDLSSLLFSTGAAADTTVTASVDGTVVGTATIDPTRAVTDDSTGRASFSVPIDESLAGGAHTATFVLDTTGTEISVGFAVAAGAGAGTPTPGPTTEPTPAPTTPPTTGPAPTPTTAPVAGSHHLAETGVDATPAFAAGIAALLLGLGMTVARLRRRTAAK